MLSFCREASHEMKQKYEAAGMPYPPPDLSSLDSMEWMGIVGEFVGHVVTEGHSHVIRN